MDIIIEEYNHYVYTIINNIAPSLSYEDKEEIESDVFYLLWKNQDKINSNLKSYLASVARNCTYKKLKERKIDIEYDDNLYNQDIYFDKMLIIDEALEQLNEEDKDIFVLYYVYGLKAKEIAVKKNIKTNYVKVKLYRMRKKLKEFSHG